MLAINPNPKSDNQLYENCLAVLKKIVIPDDLIIVKDEKVSRPDFFSSVDKTVIPDDLIFVKDEKVSRRDFFSSVNKTVMAESSNLNKFHLHTSYDSSFEWLLNKSLRCALERNVRDVDLSLWHDLNHVERHDQIVLDDSLFVNSSLTNLKLSCDFVNPTIGLFGWTNLKSLSLSKKSDLDNNSLEIILCETPRLETFELIDCYGFTRLNLRDSKSVKNFVISGRKELVDDGYVHLNAPFISSLTVDGALTSCSLYIDDVSSLVEAKFSYHADDYGYVNFANEYEEQDALELHILRLRHVKNYPLKLKLGKRLLEVLSLLKAEDFLIPKTIKVVDDEEFN